MIIAGYPGIGKTTLASNDFRFIDLESSIFQKRGGEEWYRLYCEVAINLSQQGYDVFVSTHKQVRDILINSKEEFIAIIPAIEIKRTWENKLELRYEHDKNEKNHRALHRARNHYNEDIGLIMRECPVVVIIKDSYYDLITMVEIGKEKLHAYKTMTELNSLDKLKKLNVDLIQLLCANEETE